MLNRLKLGFDLYKNDALAIFKVALLLLVIILFFRFIPIVADKMVARKFSHQTFGLVVEVEADKYIREALEGGKIVTKGYLVKFEYTIDNQTFNTEKYINKSTLNLQQKAKIRNAKAGDTIIVKYNPENPEFPKLELP